jgi:hypothetical protein
VCICGVVVVVVVGCIPWRCTHPYTHPVCPSFVCHPATASARALARAKSPATFAHPPGGACVHVRAFVLRSPWHPWARAPRGVPWCTTPRPPTSPACPPGRCCPPQGLRSPPSWRGLPLAHPSCTCCLGGGRNVPLGPCPPPPPPPPTLSRHLGPPPSCACSPHTHTPARTLATKALVRRVSHHHHHHVPCNCPHPFCPCPQV